MRSLATRVAFAGAVAAFFLLVLVGASAFVALRGQMRDNLQATAQHAAEAEGRQLATILGGIMSHLTSTAVNPLVANALTDTQGRNAYVVPFLGGIKAVQGVEIRVAMTDFLGREMAFNGTGLAPELSRAASAAIAKASPIGVLVDDKVAAFAAPIIYNATGTAEGALVYSFDLASLAPKVGSSALIGRVSVDLTEASRAEIPSDRWGSGTFVHDLGNGLKLRVTAQADPAALARPQSDLLKTFIVAGFGCLAVVGYGSLAVARSVTRHLRRLEHDSARVVATGSFSQRFDEGGKDEVGRLARSFNQVLDRLELAHRDLAAQAERQLRDSEERYRLLAEFASDVISRVGADGTMRYLSPAVARVLGFQPAEILGSRLTDFVHPDDVDAVKAAFESSEGTDISPFWFRMQRADGGYLWVEASGHRVADTVAGGGGDVVAILRDVERRKQAEDALDAKTQDLERSNAELEQFAYVASHDLREPLRMVSNYLQLIDRRLGDDKDEDMRDFMGFAIDGARRMDRLILDLLEFARVGRNRPPFEPVDIAVALTEAGQPFRSVVDERGGVLDLPAEAPFIIGDRQELVRLFQNLIGNAVKYTPADRPPQLRITAETEGSEVVIAVADGGIGIAPEHVDRIFLIFQRLHGRGQYEGTGVGLAICKKIVDRHDGRIWVESVPGEGSTFKVAFRLPAAPDKPRSRVA